MIKPPLKAFAALQGNHSPKDYISLGMHIEELGFDRIYVYDDLLDYPAWPILGLIAEHTKQIQLGPCLVSGLYAHPIRIARDAAFLDRLSKGRSILGIGKGAFLESVGMKFSNELLREASIETVLLAQQILNKNESPFDGKHFNKAAHVKLNDNTIKPIPIVFGSCDQRMAYFAGQCCDEFQTGEIWNSAFLKRLYAELHLGSEQAKRNVPPFSVGGITCISADTKQAYETVRPLVALYLPYLNSIIQNEHFILSKQELEKVRHYVSVRDIKKAASLISDEVVDYCALVGSPDQVLEKIHLLRHEINIYGISFGPPYGTLGNTIENLKFIKDEVVSKL
ncbi:MAG: LLM class flavin-dependent oxidoreductase [Alphaproteobacteria bacterium]|nr:LLM class flavin-dependent oxidoreductase [Alphaproteobacteria bacterium]